MHPTRMSFDASVIPYSVISALFLSLLISQGLFITLSSLNIELESTKSTLGITASITLLPPFDIILRSIAIFLLSTLASFNASLSILHTLSIGGPIGLSLLLFAESRMLNGSSTSTQTGKVFNSAFGISNVKLAASNSFIMISDGIFTSRKTTAIAVPVFRKVYIKKLRIPVT